MTLPYRTPDFPCDAHCQRCLDAKPFGVLHFPDGLRVIPANLFCPVDTMFSVGGLDNC